MKSNSAFILFVFLVASLCAAQTDNTFYAKQFPGQDDAVSLPGVASDGAKGIRIKSKVAVGASIPAANLPAAVTDYPYSAKCDGSTNDQAAFTAALAAANWVIVPASATGCNIGSGITVGAGQVFDGGNTPLFISANNAIGITVAGSNAIVQNIKLRLLGSPTGVVGILVGSPTAQTMGSTLNNINIIGPSSGTQPAVGLEFYGHNKEFNYYNQVTNLWVQYVGNAIVFDADNSLYSPNRQMFFNVTALDTSSWAVEVKKGGTEQFFGLNVASSYGGINVESDSSTEGEYVVGYLGEAEINADIQVGAGDIYNQFYITSIANPTKVVDNSGNSTNTFCANGSSGGFNALQTAGCFINASSFLGIRTSNTLDWSAHTIFPSRGMNQVAYIDFGNISLAGSFDITIGSVYQYVDALGSLKESLVVSRKASSPIMAQYGRIVQADGPMQSHFALGQFMVDESNHLKIPIYQIPPSSVTAAIQPIYVKISGLYYWSTGFLPPPVPVLVAPSSVPNSQTAQMASLAALLPGAAGETRPTCAATPALPGTVGEGYMWYVKGSGSRSGSFQICQNQSGIYTWVSH